MSRREEFQKTTNPANYIINWKASQKTFIVYDMAKKENFELKDLKFINVTENISITGFHEPSNQGIFSNIIKNLSTETLTVRTKTAILAQGTYSNIKNNLQGGNYTIFINCLAMINGKIEKAVLQLSGSGLKNYFDFRQKNKGQMLNNWVKFSGVTEEKKGAVKYFSPVFFIELPTITSESTLADMYYDEVVAYHNQLKKEETKSNDEFAGLEEVKETIIDDLPY